MVWEDHCDRDVTMRHVDCRSKKQSPGPVVQRDPSWFLSITHGRAKSRGSTSGRGSAKGPHLYSDPQRKVVGSYVERDEVWRCSSWPQSIALWVPSDSGPQGRRRGSELRPASSLCSGRQVGGCGPGACCRSSEPVVMETTPS